MERWRDGEIERWRDREIERETQGFSHLSVQKWVRSVIHASLLQVSYI